MVLIDTMEDAFRLNQSLEDLGEQERMLALVTALGVSIAVSNDPAHNLKWVIEALNKGHGDLEKHKAGGVQ